ncbi:hypothetical protein PNEG_03297 [Pneumocystis murina B123]|uniref:60S ribosomal protein L29 n=1 Tax=Pneumocystis murina (strain B123) TaxID=1069680 RepID=M7PDD5_PNEMU|nr:hypothetical protein PNEG_03297 [Pneumocystis murina B123]EMR08469.1 hypothetical protein PNEG_03297 [Pneumocystis murina B123]
MAKSKNHTNHNQNKKAHRNGIRRPKIGCFLSLKYVDPKFRLNRKYAVRGTCRALRKTHVVCTAMEHTFSRLLKDIAVQKRVSCSTILHKYCCVE